jgi:glycosyltransferase involved in cell wall biosynthesis
MVTSFYNGYDKFLNNWVLAILNSEVMPDEVVLVISGDDYDETNIDNARLLLNNKINYQIIKIPHKCMGNARNAGVKVASNEWVLYLNVDDTITENAIRDIKENLSDDIDILTGSMLWVDHFNKKTSMQETYVRKYQITRESIMNGGITNDHSTYRKSLWEQSPYIEYSGDIDMAFWLGLVQAGARIKCIDNLLTAHYFRPDTVFGKYSKEDLREIKRMMAIWQKEGVHSDRFKSDNYKHDGDYNFKHKTTDFDLSIVIAFKNDGEFRNRHLNWTVSRYKLMFPDAEIIISEDTTSKDGTWNDFCKSKYINLGVAKAKNNNILITDADIVLEKNAVLDAMKQLDK